LLAAACGPVPEATSKEVESTAGALSWASATDFYSYFDTCPDCSKNAATVGDGVVFDQLNMNGSNGKRITVIDEKLCTAPIDPVENYCPSWERAFTYVPNDYVSDDYVPKDKRMAYGLMARRFSGGAWHDDVAAADLPGRLVITIQSDCEATYELFVQRATSTELWEELPAPRPADYERRKEEYEHLPEYEIGFVKTGGCRGETFLSRGGIGSRRSSAGGSGGQVGSGGSPGNNDLTFGAHDRLVGGVVIRPVCPVEDAVTDNPARPAIVYSGDNIDSDHKEVTDRSSIRWFNLACNGTALAKLHFLRHTRQVGGSNQIAADRQTLLKMLTADYCGTGTSYTINGHPLRYWDGMHGLGRTTFPTLSEAERSEIEAMWTPSGAACLNTPRYVQRSEVPCTRRDWPSGPLPECTESEMAKQLANRHPVVSAHPKPMRAVRQGPPERRMILAR
jgi:hypothetical protein